MVADTRYNSMPSAGRASVDDGYVLASGSDNEVSRWSRSSEDDEDEDDLDDPAHKGYKDRPAADRRSPTAIMSEALQHEDVADEQHYHAYNAFSAYITGENTSTGDDPSQGTARRSHLIYTWRRAPLVNHNYDAVGAPFVFAPDSKVMIVWGMVMLYSVSWTLIVAPFEIAIVDVWQWVEIVDWIVTLMFLLDIPIKFFVAIEQRGTGGVSIQFDREIITRNYMRGPLFLDLICALPLDSVHVTHSSSKQHWLRVIRLVRLTRIVKLQRNHLLSRIDLPYSVLTALTCLLLSVVCAHWIACIWAALSFMQVEGRKTWLDALIETKLDLREERELHPMYIYIWSLYYSVSLITTVGFGDVAPQTDLECGICTSGIVVGSVLWAYILSSLLDVLNRMNPHRMDFERTMDELNRMMHDHSMPDALRNDVRHYFYECQDLWKLQRRGDLIARMSRSLKGRVTLALNGAWIEKVVYIRGLFLKGIPGSTAFVVEISRKMTPKIFSPGEKLESPVLYIVRKGLVAAGCKLLAVGDACGEDLLLTNPENRSPFVLVALTMSGTLALTRASLLASLEKFPLQRKEIRQYGLWLAVRRGLARELRAMSGPQNKKRFFFFFCFFFGVSAKESRRIVGG